MYRIKKVSIAIFVLLFFATLWKAYLKQIIAKVNAVESVKSIGEILNSGDLDNVNTRNGRDYLSRINTDCKDTICSQFLSSRDHQNFKSCVERTWELSVNAHIYIEPAQSTCVFINGSGKFPMALVSYPSSGGDFVRGLIQSTTGLCTGAVHCDTALRRNGYPGENIRTATTFIVTTHQLFPRWSHNRNLSHSNSSDPDPAYNGAVFVMRNPFDVMAIEFMKAKKRMWAINKAKNPNVGDTTLWNSFVKKEALVWQQTVLGWLIPRKPMYPILIVRYEELVLHTKAQLEKIMKFLQVPYSKSQLDRVVRRNTQQLQTGSGILIRQYTEYQKKYVGNLIKATSSIITRYSHRPLTEYMI